MNLNRMLLWVSLSFVIVGVISLLLYPYITSRY